MITLVINPGSTSTKLAIYEDQKELCREGYSHSKDELSQYDTIMDQVPFREKIVMEFLEKYGYTIERLDCVISRGGAPPEAHSGATIIDENLITALRERPKEPHPAAVGPVIAYNIKQKTGIPAFIYDPVSADELIDEARIFGVKGIEHDSMAHVLNSHAMAIAQAEEDGKKFDESTYKVGVLGGGNSIAVWSNGRLIDTCPGDKGTFSAERCGPLRAEKMVELCNTYDTKTIMGWFHGKGGMVSLLGTNDLRDVEKMIVDGDEFALRCEQAMAYQFAKSISSLLPACIAYGTKLDGIILTGGGAYWERLTDDMKKYLAFTNVPVYVRPGENEMLALGQGAYRVVNGLEKAHTYGVD